MRSLTRKLLAGVRPLVAAATLLAAPLLAQATMVRMYTSLGPVDIQLLDNEAPATVANILGYARSGAFDSTFFHRSIAGFIVQGGGYNWFEGANTYTKVPAGPPVVNEYSPARSNVRGTIAMAKVGATPPTPASINSATTEWFFNLANNAANLDNQNGGFTVFGRITSPGMEVADAIAALPKGSAGGALTDLPILHFPADGKLVRSILVLVDKVLPLPTRTTDADRAFDYLEALYWQYLKPNGAGMSAIGDAGGVTYYFRYYPASNSYLGLSVRDNLLFYLVPEVGPNITFFDALANVMPAASAAGY